MTPAFVIVAAALLLVASGARAKWRGRRGDRTVEVHQRTLDTLGRLTAQAAGQRHPAGAAGPSPAQRASGGRRRPDDSSGLSPVWPRGRPGRTRSWWASRGRLAGTGALVVVVAAIVVAVGAVGGGDGRGHPRATEVTAPRPRPVTTSPPATPAASVPAAPQAPVLVGSDGHTARYRVAAPAFVSVTSTGQCWAEVRRGDQSGAVLFSGLLHSGVAQTAPAPVWLRLGNPTAATVTANGAVVSPAGLTAGIPYNLQFQLGP